MKKNLESLFVKEELAPFYETIIWNSVENAVMYEGVDVSRYTDVELVNYSVARALGIHEPADEETPESTPEEVTREDGRPNSAGVDREVSWSPTHQEDLSEEADRFLDRGKDELAILLYATWVEHWINRIILMCSIGEGTPPELATALIRSCRLELKIGKVWTSLGMPRFDKELARRISRLMEARNGFVHYKWTHHDEESLDKENEDAKNKAREAKETVRLLTALEDAVFYDGRTESIKKHIHDSLLEKRRAARKEYETGI
ncbi:hypothetical protein [Streptomyces misionensis]|uniref:hypothetical protein n=1 Tax=Streptomyces misionensis TaxID=67331 RepID=UPI0036773209